jgi:DNA-binding Lrp family transcriptional regulator
MTKSWRDVLPVHPAANLFPMMPEAELKAQGEDIKNQGLRDRIDVLGTPKPERVTGPMMMSIDPAHFDYQLLDGRNRLDAMELAGIEVAVFQGNGWLNTKLFNVIIAGDIDPFDYVISKNVRRRHLTNEQKLELVDRVLKLKPDRSNRQIAELTKTSHPTVAKRRAKLEAAGDVETVTTSTDTRGRKQPTRKPRCTAQQCSAERVDRAKIAIEAINDVLTQKEKAAVVLSRHVGKAIDVETREQATAPLVPPTADQDVPNEVAAPKPTEGLRSFIRRLRAITNEANTAAFDDVVLTNNAQNRLRKAISNIRHALADLSAVAELAERKASKDRGAAE